jgi:chromosome segregation ATPase
MAASLRSDADSKEQPSASAAGDGTSALGVVSSSTSHGPGRSRLLKGMDPEPEQLAAKIEVLEERLNDKKEQLLEKELVLDEVSSLSDKLRMQAAETRGSTLDLAKKVNEIRSKIRHTTRKMMACVSELSMYQASAMRLEGEKGTKEAALAAARERAAQEQPPTDDCEHEWVRMERDRARKQEALLAGAQRVAEMHEDDYSALSLAGRSTAEARPNAYIPSELGIPKPYGALAPFKPSVVGANIRHIRAPKTQEIQL